MMNTQKVGLIWTMTTKDRHRLHQISIKYRLSQMLPDSNCPASPFLGNCLTIRLWWLWSDGERDCFDDSNHARRLPVQHIVCDMCYCWCVWETVPVACFSVSYNWKPFWKSFTLSLQYFEVSSKSLTNLNNISLLVIICSSLDKKPLRVAIFVLPYNIQL